MSATILPFGATPHRGVWVLWRRGSTRGGVASALAAVAFILIVIQPTLAAHMGTRASMAAFVAAAVLLLPFWRRILVQPLFGIIMALAVIAVFSRDPLALLLPIVAYPLFMWFCYDTVRARYVYLSPCSAC